MKTLWKKTLKYLKGDADRSVAGLYKFIGYMVVFFQIFLWSQAFWLSLIETVIFVSSMLKGHILDSFAS